MAPETMPSRVLADTKGFLGDVRGGKAGFGVRIGLSLGAAGLALTCMMVSLGFLESAWRRVHDEHVAIAMGLSALMWLVMLWAIWATFPRWRRALRTGFAIACVWAAAIVAIILVNSMVRRGEEFLTAGCVFGGITATVLILTGAIHAGTKGRALYDDEGVVDVRCPECGYSMAGLESSTCPECGSRFQLDELIRLQGYEALRPSLPRSAEAVKIADGAGAGGGMLPEAAPHA
jgi:hypothetical protein